MNTLESCIITDPFGKEEECAKFIIDNIAYKFTLSSILNVNKQYTFSFWVKSEEDGNILAAGDKFSTSNDWVQYVRSFTADDNNLDIRFRTVGTYYIYHPQLEIGNKVTDWSKSPEDVDESVQTAHDAADKAQGTADEASQTANEAQSLIQQLRDSISMLVTDADGTSLMTQTDDGWTFSMAQTQQTIEEMQQLIVDLDSSLGTVDGVVEALQSAVDGIEESVEWIRPTTYEDEPCLALGETDSDFKLLITNTRIMFLEGTTVLTYMTNQAMHIKKAVIEEELQQDNFVWTIRERADGSKNLGLIWKGVFS